MKKEFGKELKKILSDPESNNMLHNHTDNSLGDGAQTVEQMFDKAKENGATAVAITDHRVATGWIDALTYAKKIGLKAILGIEAEEEGRHILLLAKNYTGFQALSQFITETNNHMTKDKPQCTREMLQTYFGNGSLGHGNVIASSACIGGILAYYLSDGYRIDKATATIQGKIDAIEIPPEYEKISEALKKLETEERKLAAKIKEDGALAKKSFVKAERNLKKLTDEGIRTAALAALESEKEESVKAAVRLPKLKAKKESLKAKKKPLKEAMKAFTAKINNLTKYQEEINNLESQRLSQADMLQNAREAIFDYREIFGDKDFYVEVQYHGYEHEAEIFSALAKLANETSTKLLATNDAHYANAGDSITRTLLRNARYALKSEKWMDEDLGDDQLYMKTGRELAEALSEILSEEDICKAFMGIKEITNACNVVIPETKHYPKIEDSKKKLREMCEDGIKDRYPEGMSSDRYERMEYELSVIDKMGFNDYFCEVADFIKFAKDQADNSLEIGPGRGSGAGSIVCYLCKITELDPMKYDLIFERFLNPARQTMPDIDTDFSEHARNISIEYVKNLYGEESIASIMTKNKMAARAAFDYAGKLYGIQHFGEKGKFASLVKELKLCIPDKANKISEAKDAIVSNFGNNKEAMQILEYAERIEGFTTSFGTHAAGVIIGDGTPIKNYIPLIRIINKKNGVTTETWAIQANMVQAEADLKFIKMDFLGLDTLNVMTMAMRLITKRHGVKIDPMNLPIETEVLEKIYQTGFTNFVFQFESAGMKQMLRDFKPETFEDLILLVAAYRPGPIDFLPSIIDVKSGKKEPTYLFPELEPLLSKTYGAIIYQEQVMQICQQLAGYSVADADNVRRFMSKKKMEPLKKERNAFIHGDESREIEGCVALLSGKESNKLSKKEIENRANILFDQLIEFAKYAFNKSHAAAYAKVSYMTAWTKYHYFPEFVSAAIMEQTKKQSQLSSDCETMGVKILLPDINVSEVNVEPMDDGQGTYLRYGLKLIADVKSNAELIVAERDTNGRFRSPEDFIQRVSVNSGVLKALVLSGTFDAFTNNRESLLQYMSEYAEKYKAFIAAKENGKNVKEKEAELKKVRMVSSDELELKTKLDYEMKYLGMWISGNPVEDYDFKDIRGYKKNEDLLPENEPENGSYAVIGGVIMNVKKTFTKKDNRPMAILDVLDAEGVNIHVCVFPKSYAEYKTYIEEGKILIIGGKLNVETDDEGVPSSVTLYADRIKEAVPNKGLIFIAADNFEHFERVVNIAREYQMENGTAFAVYDQMFGDIYQGEFKINREILNRKGLQTALAM